MNTEDSVDTRIVWSPEELPAAEAAGLQAAEQQKKKRAQRAKKEPAAEGEAPLTFTPLDGQIALFTVLGGLFLWLLVAFILNHREKKTA